MKRFFPDKESVRLLQARQAQLLAAPAGVVERRRWNRGQLEVFQQTALRLLLA